MTRCASPTTPSTAWRGRCSPPTWIAGFGIAARVRSGTFAVNQGYIMDPVAPFGGVKRSGYGRELGREGLESYLVSQSVSSAK